MNSLDLYAIVEQHLGFEEEIQELYQFYKNCIIKYKITSLIDIGCGQGAFLQSLDKSIQTLGIDLSEEQIKICKKKNLNAQAIDIKDVQDKFDMASAVFDVLNYLDDGSLDSFIQNTSSSLNINGYFIFDINTLYGFEEIAEGSLNINEDNKFIAIDAIYEDNKLITNINLFEKNILNNTYKREENHITQYFHTDTKISQILKTNGFEIISIKPFQLHSDEKADKHIFITQKIK